MEDRDKSSEEKKYYCKNCWSAEIYFRWLTGAINWIIDFIYDVLCVTKCLCMVYP